MAKRPPESWPIEKSEAEWRAQLTPEQYHVTREAGTERAFTGPQWDEKAAGDYHCVGCDEKLFDSEHKYDSGTGWPSFTQGVRADALAEKDDRAFLMRRTEVLCARCGAHLGHVFDDGPPPTGMRYCMNGHALRFRPRT